MPIRRRGQRWQVDVSYRGRRARAATMAGGTKEQARDLERHLVAELHAARLGRAPARTLNAAIDRWLGGEAASLRSLRHTEGHARALFPYTAGRPLSAILHVAEEVREGMLRDGLAPATINRRLAILRRVARLAARRWGWLDAEPVIELLREENARHVYLTPAEVEKVAGMAERPEVGDAVRLLALTGLRRSELLRLGPEHYRDGCLVLDGRTKSGRPRIIPVPPEAEPLLARLPLPLSLWQLDEGWRRARRAAGMEHVRLHDLRHTYASWLVQAGVPLTAVGALMGHSTPSMTARYAHLAPDDLRAAVTRMVEHRDRKGRSPAGHDRNGTEPEST